MSKSEIADFNARLGFAIGVLMGVQWTTTAAPDAVADAIKGIEFVRDGLNRELLAETARPHTP